MAADCIETQVTALLARMSLAEKIGQLAQYSHGNGSGPDNVVPDLNVLAARGGVGSVLDLTGAESINSLQRQAVEGSRLGIPILFALDVIHGYRTIYPIPLGMAAAWNAPLAERCARMAAIEASAAGIRWTFSPMVDVARDARWGRITEGSGEDPYLGEVMAAAWVRGYQGEDLAAPTSILACAKHYAGHGGAEGGREYNLVDISERSLREVYLPPFKAAVDAGVGTIMSAFNTLQGVPASANPHILLDILRGEWGFPGAVVSDWSSVGELLEHGVALDGKGAALLAITAGVDMDMQSDLYALHLGGLVQSGRLDMGIIDGAVARILRLKYALGLFERPYTDQALAPSVMLGPGHLELAGQAAEESFVLLRNEPVDGRPILPLTGDLTVALIGSLADSPADMFGAWVKRGDAGDVITLRQALAERLGDRLVYVGGVGAADEADAEFGQALAVAAAASADVVVMALGETHDMSGEAHSRANLGLPGRQESLLRAVVATGKPVVLVLFSGRPLALPWEAGHVPAILLAWFPGVQAGPALVRTLYGGVNPAGKLTASFPRSVGQMPLYYNTLSTGRPSRDPSQISAEYTSGYIDEANSPLFPFGWGLSYTSFECSPTRIPTSRVRAADLNQNGAIAVEATVTNSGSRAGAEVVQLYIRQRGTSVARPVRELKGFEKITLAAGEARQVRFALTKKELAFWNFDMRQTVEPGELTVWVAPNSQDGQAARIMIEP